MVSTHRKFWHFHNLKKLTYCSHGFLGRSMNPNRIPGNYDSVSSQVINELKFFGETLFTHHSIFL